MSEPGDLPDRLYEAAFMPELWPAALDALAGSAGATGGIVFMANASHFAWTSSDALGETGHDFFDKGWLTRNTRTPLLMQRTPDRFVRDSDVFDDQGLARDPMQAELLVPAGFGREIAGRFVTASGDNIVVSLHRALSRGRYSDETVGHLDSMRPDLARALMLACRLGLQRLRCAVDVLDAVGLAAAVVDRKGTVLASNRLLDAEPFVVSRAFSQLGLRSPESQKLLDAAFATLARSRTTAPPGVPLRSPGGTTTAIVHVIPLRREARGLLSSAEAVVVIMPTTSPALPSAALLQALFDLTEAEARVARGVMTGTVRQIAVASGLSVETIRTQLKAVLSKTGTRRQADLTGLLSRLALVKTS